MKLTCNIDQRGRKARIIAGIAADSIGVIGILVGVLTNQLSALVGGIICSAAGCFMIFEGIKGWCAARAMGIKTPM